MQSSRERGNCRKGTFPCLCNCSELLSLLQAGQHLRCGGHAEQRPATAEEERSEGRTPVNLTRSQREEEQKEKAQGKGISRFKTAEREGMVIEQQYRRPFGVSVSQGSSPAALTGQGQPSDKTDCWGGNSAAEIWLLC